MKKITQGTVMDIPFPADLSLSQQREYVVELERTLEDTKHLSMNQAQTRRSLHALLPSILDKAFEGEL